MDLESNLVLLTSEWELQEGFLGKLRLGEFDRAGLERLIKLLESLEVDSNTLLDRRLVALTWFIPVFMQWQKPHLAEKGENLETIDFAIQRVLSALYRILGVP